jgi:hypothetical protein
MNSLNIDGVLLVLAVLAIFIVAVITANVGGKETARRESEYAAVLAGHAEYYLNEKHERVWRWKEAK